MARRDQVRRFQSHVLNISAILASACLPVGATLVVDYVSIHSHTSSVQKMANSAVVTAAKSLALMNAQAEKIRAVRKSHSGCRPRLIAARTVKVDGELVHITTSGVEGLTAVRVSVELNWDSLFGSWSLVASRPLIAGAEVTLEGLGKFTNKPLPPSLIFTRVDALTQFGTQPESCSV